jgi:hypothetical protein
MLFGAARFCFLAAGGAPRLPFSRSICESITVKQVSVRRGDTVV